MLDCFLARAPRGTLPLVPIPTAELDAWLGRGPEAVRAWVKRSGFRARGGETCLLPDKTGRLARALLGVGDEALWSFASGPAALPEGAWRIEGELDRELGSRAALGWALGSYRFERYKRAERRPARLVWPAGIDRADVTRQAEAVFLARDLINTPAEDMGPAELAEVARDAARRQGARCTVVVGTRLLDRNYPCIHTVGRASAREPRLIDIRWGRPSDPKVTLVGKGVCFDTGGLDLKGSENMLLMKKDMGGAAIVLGLAQAVMDAGLKVRLRVLIPAVENAVGGNAYRPLDVIRTRKGLTVEVGNTDAEGRLILCDALTEADREKPVLLLDFATLTGAARVALGTDLPALFSNDRELSAALVQEGLGAGDPVWPMPLHEGYEDQLESKVADLSNIGKGSYAGAILGALYLSRFVSPGTRWAHLDVMAYNTRSRPGRPEGGEGVGLRAAYGLLRTMFGGK